MIHSLILSMENCCLFEGEKKKKKQSKSLLEVQLSTRVLNKKKEPNHPASTRSSRQNAKPTFQPRGGETELTEWSSTFVFELTKEKLMNLGKEPRADLRDCRWASMNVRLKSPAKGRSPKCWPQPYLIKGQAL